MLTRPRQTLYGTQYEYSLSELVDCIVEGELLVVSEVLDGPNGCAEDIADVVRALWDSNQEGNFHVPRHRRTGGCGWVADTCLPSDRRPAPGHGSTRFKLFFYLIEPDGRTRQLRVISLLRASLSLSLSRTAPSSLRPSFNFITPNHRPHRGHSDFPLREQSAAAFRRQTATRHTRPAAALSALSIARQSRRASRGSSPSRSSWLHSNQRQPAQLRTLWPPWPSQPSARSA